MQIRSSYLESKHSLDYYVDELNRRSRKHQRHSFDSVRPYEGSKRVTVDCGARSQLHMLDYEDGLSYSYKLCVTRDTKHQAKYTKAKVLSSNFW